MLLPTRIQSHFPRVISEIMAEHNIEPVDSSEHIVLKDAGLTVVAQHTECYISGRRDQRPPYRYRRYSEVLRYLKASDRPITHVDIGCGAGLFSWALLDWAMERNVELERIRLHGLDHCQAMIDLAEMVKAKLSQVIANYPDLNYCRDVGTLLHHVTRSHRDGTNYVITLGHVLVQAHTPGDIHNYSRVVKRVVELSKQHSTCVLIAIDARGQPTALQNAWESLLNRLETKDVCHKIFEVPPTSINDGYSAKAAQLYIST